jgi:PAS domain S-box-containing protein
MRTDGSMESQFRAKILLVEDDPGVARLEQVRLERAGFQVITAATAEEGLEQVASGEIELIVLDQRLNSGTSGLEFFRRVKDSGHNVPAILVTGLNDENLLLDALRAGVRDFVPKTPNFLNHLEPIVSRVLDQVRTERELAESKIVTREHEARRRELEHEIAHRKRIEQALREAEEYLRLMVESVKDFAIFTTDPQGRIVSWNPGAERLFGFPEAEILGQQFDILFTPEDRAAGVPAREIATAAASGRASDERWHQRKDGGRFFASGVVTPIFDEDNKLRGFTKIARDITERKQAEEAVREAAVRLKAIVETAVDGIITIDEHGIVESINPAAERVFDYPHHEVVGHNVSMLMSEPERDEHSDYLQEYLQTGRQKIIGTIREVRGRRRDGSVFPMELAVSETRLGLRRIFTGIVRDITEFKKAIEERLRLLNELEGERALLNSLLDNAPVGFGFFDHDLRYLRLNPAMADLSAMPVEAHLGRSLADVLPDLSSELSKSLRQVFDTGSSIVNKEVTGETASEPGHAQSWLCNFYPVKLPDGTMLGAGVVVTDINDRKRMEDALKDDDQRKDQFLAMLAHELRNPLAPISNAVQIMQLEGPNGANFRWSTEVIDDQIKHMTRMVDDLLDVSRITRNKVDLQKQTIALGDIVELAVEASRPLIQDYNHKLAIALPAEPLLVDVDPARLVQVLSNLVNNAAKYTDEGGKISLTAESAGSEVIIRVRDNGIGISPDLLPKVFDLFTQADRTLSRSRGGLGIGLTLVRSLIELHDGRVTASSKGLGQGSEFVVYLPRVVSTFRPEEVADDLALFQDSQVPPRRILVVDDKRSNAESLEVLLQTLGQEVYTAFDGKSALELARQQRPDIVLLDIGLPVMDGYEVARQCRSDAALKHLMLVAMTGYGQDSDRSRSQQAGFDAHLVKPVSLQDLLLLLKHADISASAP